MLVYSPSAAEVSATILSTSFFVFSLSAISFILHFHLRASRGEGIRPRRRLRDLNSLWTVRILLAIFACIWCAAEFFRFRFLHPFWVHHNFCRAHVLLSQGFAEPCIFTTLLFLLRISVQGKICHPNAFSSVLSLALFSSIPFLLLHTLFLSLSPWFFSPLGIPPEVFFGLGTTNFSHGVRCSYPLFSTTFIGIFGAAYVPFFLSACWRAAEVVINKRLRIRLYALAAAVVMGITMQVVALSFSAFWSPSTSMFQGLRFTAFFGIFSAAFVGEVVLVVCPIFDALNAVQPVTNLSSVPNRAGPKPVNP